jgi:hypothetical protein
MVKVEFGIGEKMALGLRHTIPIAEMRVELTNMHTDMTIRQIAERIAKENKIKDGSVDINIVFTTCNVTKAPNRG